MIDSLASKLVVAEPRPTKAPTILSAIDEHAAVKLPTVHVSDGDIHLALVAPAMNRFAEFVLVFKRLKGAG